MGKKVKDKPIPLKKSIKPPSSPKLITRDPSLPLSLPTTSKIVQLQTSEENKEPLKKRFCRFVYDKHKKTFCGRTAKSWACILGYSIMYLIFLTTYTMVFLYGSLMILKHTVDYTAVDKILLLTYSEKGIGITATPTAENIYPIIWYRRGETVDYEKYVRAIDRLLLVNRRKKDLNYLGPCAQAPYGYGESPCILLRINRQWKWAGKPLQLNSSKIHTAPALVKEWIQKDAKKLWFYCSGCDSYDREHIGRLNYYPYPPGIDPDLFPLDTEDMSPLIAVKITNFTLGVSLAVECKLWYDSGPSSIGFVLYVTADGSNDRH
ncbi:hypothetical protein K1T71_006798 [Dendrolimus kikuchii]|uniref:Uncharacterized protein n=1 Tax=Dendrolimus kikuchii TaxID=765133 RepID=A0ACC1D285_9NEOP|nr:hypothetical protein K1T71_006798 [Dendrolimus kikuchii]